MRGILIHYNAQSDQGLIRAEDGKRYAFYGQDWQSERKPVVNDEIDFEIDGNVAYDIYLLKPGRAPAPGPDLSKLGQSVAQGARSFGNMGSGIAASGFGQRILADWTFFIAVITLVGCFLPYLTSGRASASLIGVDSAIGEAMAVFRQIEEVSRFVPERRLAPFGVQTKQLPVQPADFSAARLSLRLGYLLYLVPLMSLLVIAYEFLRRRLRRVAFWQGLLAIVLPIAVPVLIIAVLYAQLPPENRKVMSQAGVDFSFFGLGFWVIVLSGVAQLLNYFGLFRRKPASLVGER